MSRLGMGTECPEQLGEQALPHMLSFSPTGETATEKASLGIGCTSWGGLTGESTDSLTLVNVLNVHFFFSSDELKFLICTAMFPQGPSSLDPHCWE